MTDHALYEIRDGGGKISAQEEICRREPRKDEDAPHRVYAERRLEDVAHPLIDGGGIREQKYEDGERRDQLDMLALVALFKKFGHGARLQDGGHHLGAVCQHQPSREGADEHIAYADPHRGQAEVPAEFARISHKDDGGKIGRAVCESAKPTSHALVCEHEPFHARALAARDESDGKYDRHIDAEDEPLRPDLTFRRRDEREHFFLPLCICIGVAKRTYPPTHTCAYFPASSLLLAHMHI